MRSGISIIIYARSDRCVADLIGTRSPSRARVPPAGDSFVVNTLAVTRSHSLKVCLQKEFLAASLPKTRRGASACLFLMHASLRWGHAPARSSKVHGLLYIRPPARGCAPLEQGGHVQERLHELLSHEAHEVLETLLVRVRVTRVGVGVRVRVATRRTKCSRPSCVPGSGKVVRYLVSKCVILR